MPIYHTLGQVPKKRHTAFRKPDGGIYAEELMGHEGFTGTSALLYHIHPPTTVKSVKRVKETKLEPDAVGGAVERMESRRADGMAWASRRLARQKQLKPGVSAKRAAHVLWLVASFDAFDLLFTGRGLSARETGRILADTFEDAVCA